MSTARPTTGSTIGSTRQHYRLQQHQAALQAAAAEQAATQAAAAEQAAEQAAELP
jgi:hypothetical protein